MNAADVPLWDGLAFAGPSCFGLDVSEDDLLGAMDAAGVEGAVVAPSKPPTYALPPANDAVLALAASQPGRLRALARVDPWRGRDAVAELRRTAANGAVGVLLHPWEECFSIADPVVTPVVAQADDLGLPVVIPGGYPWVSEALQIADLARRFPHVLFVVTNGAQLNMSGLAGVDVDRALAASPNIAVHGSGLYRQDFLDNAIATIGPERVAFGSSAPYFDLRLEVARMRLTTYPDRADAELVCAGNTLRWFGGVTR